MIVVRMYELNTTATCVLSSLPPCHYIHVGACECACTCANSVYKNPGTYVIIYIINIYMEHIETVARQKGDRTYFQVTVVLLTAQIHQGIRLSPLKVLVSLVFRPASNLLLRLLHICNNATFALLHSKPLYDQRDLNKLRERDVSIVHISLRERAGHGQGKLRGN